MAMVSVSSLKLDGHDAVQLRHRLGDVREHVGRDHHVAEADHRHAHLLAQGLGQLLVGDQPHAHGDLPEHLAGPLLLLLQQHLQLLVAEEAQVDQDLTDTPNRHVLFLLPGRPAVCGAVRPLVLSSSKMPRSALAIRAVMSSGSLALEQDLLLLHQALPPKLEQVVVQQLHAQLLPGLDRRGDAEGLVLADQVGDAGGDHEHLVGRDAAAADLRQQRLRKDADDRRGQLGADLLLLVGGKDVDDAVDGSLGPRGVQGAEDDVPGLGRRDGRLDGLQVAHFAHHDHVGVLPQRPPDRLGEAGHVHADLPLVDRRFLVRGDRTRSGPRW